MIPRKKKICKGCQKERYIFSKGYCKSCAIKVNSKNRLKKESKKRSNLNKLYLKQRLVFLENNPFCKAQLEGCTIRSTDVHHMQGRLGELLNDESKWMAVCRKCHTWITENPKEAINKGYSISRYNN